MNAHTGTSRRAARLAMLRRRPQTTAENRKRRAANSGFTLIELLLALVVLGLLAAIAIPSYQSFITNARNSKAMGEIATLTVSLERYRSSNGSYPPNLAALGGPVPLDPWGNPYRYLNIANGGPGVIGAARKDKNLVPINSDYDLYSIGADGKTATPLPSAPARDDIIRAMNGGFVGLARDY